MTGESAQNDRGEGVQNDRGGVRLYGRTLTEGDRER